MAEKLQRNPILPVRVGQSEKVTTGCCRRVVHEQIELPEPSDGGRDNPVGDRWVTQVNARLFVIVSDTVDLSD